MCHLVVAESVVLPAQHTRYGRSICECSHDVSIVPDCSVQSSDAEFSDDRAVLGRLHCSSRDTQCLSLLAETPEGISVRSIYERAMGSDFARLHPQIQRRFGFSSRDNLASVGTGVMEEIWHGPPYTLPFLYVGTWRRIMFPESGRNVPFQIQNYAYLDPLGRETVTWVRTFRTNRQRRFDAYMIYSEQRSCIIDYLGTHQHLAVDMDLGVAPNGGLRLRSGAQRFYEGSIAFRFPQQFSGIADVCEWYDDAEREFKIEVNVTNRVWGRLFGYKGHFQVDWQTVRPGDIPADILPHRTEKRE
jgi:hypothetical protein